MEDLPLLVGAVKTFNFESAESSFLHQDGLNVLLDGVIKDVLSQVVAILICQTVRCGVGPGCRSTSPHVVRCRFQVLCGLVCIGLVDGWLELEVWLALCAWAFAAAMPA